MRAQMFSLVNVSTEFLLILTNNLSKSRDNLFQMRGSSKAMESDAAIGPAKSVAATKKIGANGDAIRCDPHILKQEQSNLACFGEWLGQ